MSGEGETKGKKKEKEKELDKIVIRSWPKMVFLYPTLILSVFFGIFSEFEPSIGGLGVTMAVYWILAFGVNLFIMAFEFGRLRSIALFSFIVAAVMVMLFIGREYEASVLTSISNAVMNVKPLANSRFYFAVAGILGFMFILMFIHTRFNYWEVTHNELRHYTGFLGDVKRFPAPHLRMTKEINDVFEFLLLWSGTLIFYPASESKAYVLENVPRINRVEKDLEHLLSRLAVDIDPG